MHEKLDKNKQVIENNKKMTKCTACDDTLSQQKSNFSYYEDKNKDLCNRCKIAALAPFFFFSELDGKQYTHSWARTGLRVPRPDLYEC